MKLNAPIKTIRMFSTTIALATDHIRGLACPDQTR